MNATDKITDKIEELNAVSQALLDAMQELLGAAWPYIGAAEKEAAAAAIHAAGGSS